MSALHYDLFLLECCSMYDAAAVNFHYHQVMFTIVEFAPRSGAEQETTVAIVRQEWLTPQKRETFWPPYKLASKYNKSLLNGEIPDEKWDLFPIKRSFYSTDDILKAREKLKVAERQSDISSTDEGGIGKRKKKINRRFLDSSSDDSNIDSDGNTPVLLDSSTPKKKDVGHRENFELVPSLPSPPPESLSGSNEDKDSISLADTVLLSENSCIPNCVEQSPVGVDVVRKICKHLSKIECDLAEIRETQTQLLSFMKPVNGQLKAFNLNELQCKLPCQTVEDVKYLEEWLGVKENGVNFEKFLSTIGGRKLNNIVRRILEKLFTNSLALQFNWTGKNGKMPLKQLVVIKVIKEVTRQNCINQIATDDDIEVVIKNWFRFTKDRDGGREARRSRSGTDTSQ